MRASLAVLFMALSIALLLLSLPISLPLGLAWSAWQDRRQRAAADRTRCVQCGRVLTAAAVRAATADHVAALGAMQRRYPHSRVNMLRRADARCTSCGTAYHWDGRCGLFLQVKDAAARSS